MAWRNGCEEVAQSKPLFLTIYTVVIIGIVVSFFYVFSAIYSSNNLLSSPSTVSSSFSQIMPLLIALQGLASFGLNLMYPSES
ncbi:hypothetical protein HN51_065528 [Arachis hypogaea]